MRKKNSEVSATAAQVKPTESSATVASSRVQRRKTHCQLRGEAYDNGVRHCIVALVNFGYFRDDIADVFESSGIPFPSIIDLSSKGLWSFETWDDWVEAE
jgi:hypothetical protein